MHPVLLDLSESIKIYSFGTFIVLAFLVASWYARRTAAHALSADRERIFNVCFALLFIGLGGARFLYVLLNYDEFAAKPLSLLYVWQGGLVWYGGLIACLLWLSWYLPRHPALRGWALLDVFALSAGIAIFVGRWASFLSGENYGEPAAGLPWAVVFPANPYTQVPASHVGIELHPTQLYHSLHGIALFVVLRYLVGLRRFGAGALTGLFLILYAVGRFVIEIWRGDDAARGMVIDDHLSTSQLLSIPILFVGVALFFLRRHAERAGERPAHDDDHGDLTEA